MLVPNKLKHRKVRKGRIHGVASKGNYIAYGEWGLMSTEPERISARQIEAARQAMTRYTKRGGTVWIRIFPHTPVTKKPQDVKMGGGKGNLELYVAKVRPGTIMFEMAGVTEETAREAMRLAGHKLPVRTKIVRRDLTEEDREKIARALEAAANRVDVEEVAEPVTETTEDVVATEETQA